MCQDEKGHHVVQCIQKNTKTLATRFECFRKISKRLEQGNSLKAIPLTGGLTNYSYKVHLEPPQGEDDVVLFAKLSFPYALWNPDRAAHYDVQRTKNEFEMMNMVAQIAPGCVATPYLCEPVEDMMVLVTEWCENDEQLVGQVVDGNLDPRVCSALARMMAKLHCTDFDPEFNTDIRSTMRSTFTTLQNKLDSMIKNLSDDSRAAQLAQDMGFKNCKRLVDNIRVLYENQRDCLVHSDLHVKNILVERKPTTVTTTTTTTSGNSNVDQLFGSSGSLSVVDWETTFAGPIGRDLGTFFPFPLCCALAHALGGNREATINLMNAIDYIWEEYSQCLRDGGKDEDFINHAFRSIVGWCGRFMFLGFYTSGVHVEDFPIDSAMDKEILLDAIGVLGLKFMKWGFDSPDDADLTTADLRQKFKQMIWHEIVTVVALKASHETKTPMATLVNYFVLGNTVDGFKNLFTTPHAFSRLVSLNSIITR